MFWRIWIFVGLSLWVWSCKGESSIESTQTPERLTVSNGKDFSTDIVNDVEKNAENEKGSESDAGVKKERDLPIESATTPKNSSPTSNDKVSPTEVVTDAGKPIEKKSIEDAEHDPMKEVEETNNGNSGKTKDLAEKQEKVDEKPDVPSDQTEGAETPNENAKTTPTDLSKEGAAENKSCVVSNQTQFSWLVKIVDKETKKQVCTGTMITDEDILVPASCFLDNVTHIPETFYEIGKKLQAIAGGGVNFNCMQVRNVSVIYPHKGYFESTEEHDYAFLKVTPEFDVDDEDTPDLRYHLNVINSEGGLVNIHNNGPFCESPYFLDEGFNSVVAEERHLLGMKIDDCLLKWNCSADYDTCLSYLHPAHYACLKPLTPRNCSNRDRGAPLVCDEVFLGYLHMCEGEQPMIFRGLNKAIKFLELEDDHIQQPGYMGRRY